MVDSFLHMYTYVQNTHMVGTLFLQCYNNELRNLHDVNSLILSRFANKLNNDLSLVVHNLIMHSHIVLENKDKLICANLLSLFCKQK